MFCNKLVLYFMYSKLFSELSTCRPAPGLPPGKHDRFVFPYTVPCVRLSSDHWLLWGKVKGKGIAPNFPYGF